MTTIVPLFRVHPEDGILAERLSLGTITHDGLRQVFQAWNEARGIRKLPKRSNLLPEMLRGMIGRINVLEPMNGGEHFIWRLYGSHFVDATGKDRTGRTTAELQPAAY